MPNFLLNNASSLPPIAMLSTHGYVAANPPLGAADSGGEVVYVLKLAKKIAQLGHEEDIWTRRFADQPEADFVSDALRVIRGPCGGPNFMSREYLRIGVRPPREPLPARSPAKSSFRSANPPARSASKSLNPGTQTGEVPFVLHSVNAAATATSPRLRITKTSRF
jgi:hypothetical protein